MCIRFIRVVLHVHAQNQYFDYRLQENQEVARYQWVYVPFRKKIVLAFVVDDHVAPAVPVEKCLDVVEVAPLSPMPDDWYQLLLFASRYYHYPLGPSILLSIPSDFKKKNDQNFSLLDYRLTDEGREFCARTSPQESVAAEICHLIGLFDGHCSLSRLASLSPQAHRHLKKLVTKNWVRVARRACQPMPITPIRSYTTPLALSPEQRAVVQSCLSSLDSFRVNVLYGVTGSGKTQTYLQLAQHVLQKGQQVLLLVPEIGLIHQTYQNVLRSFPGIFAVCCSSAVVEKIKTQDWLSCFCGDVEMVVGTRSALFLPLPRLGLIIVDEEHDASYKQDDRLRYHARDLAIWYARKKNISLLLSSATPSLETIKQIEKGHYLCHRLSFRPDNRAMPDISLLDVREKKLIHGLSHDLLAQIAETLSRSEQSLIFINRRGFSPTLRCLNCDWNAVCPHCSVRLVFHKARKQLVCHHCHWAQAVITCCPECGNVDLSLWGVGTQRVEDALQQHFPGVKMARIDRDAMKNQSDFDRVLQKIHRREIQIIIGTQMIAKGHHFEHLTHVGVIDADYLLFSPLLRAPERLFSLLLQVSGRSGRGARAGRVLIQTSYPQLSVYQNLKTHDYWSFATDLLAQRERNSLPPFCYQAFLCARHRSEEKVWRWFTHVRSLVEQVPHIFLYDPVPMHPFQVARFYRVRLLIESSSRASLHQFIDVWHQKIAAQKFCDTLWYFNIDPLES